MPDMATYSVHIHVRWRLRGFWPCRRSLPLSSMFMRPVHWQVICFTYILQLVLLSYFNVLNVKCFVSCLPYPTGQLSVCPVCPACQYLCTVVTVINFSTVHFGGLCVGHYVSVLIVIFLFSYWCSMYNIQELIYLSLITYWCHCDEHFLYELLCEFFCNGILLYFCINVQHHWTDVFFSSSVYCCSVTVIKYGIV